MSSHNTLKVVLDWVAATFTIGSFLSLIPHLAAAMAVVWWGFRIYGQHLENKKLKMEIERGHE
jgi:hypothetical protein